MSSAARKLHAEGPHPWRVTTADYWKMLPFIEGKHVQLIEGVIVEMSPMGEPHAVTVATLVQALVIALGKKWRVRPQMPLDVGQDSVPEPDIAVLLVAEEQRHYPKAPQTAPFVCEVADSSIRLDRGAKLRLYAAAGVAEYVIADLKHGVLEVYTEPQKLGGYGKKQIVDGHKRYKSSVLPKVTLRPDEIFPRR